MCRYMAHPIDRFLPNARHIEHDHVDVSVPPERAYEVVRRFDLARSPIAKALFGIRTFVGGASEGLDLRLDSITAHAHGFRLLDEVPGRSFTVGAIGRFWKPDIEYLEVSPDTFTKVTDPGLGKIAWEVQCEPCGIGARISIELRIDATDDETWKTFRLYYAAIGPFSHFIRRHVLTMIARELGTLESVEETRALPGDDLVPDAQGQTTHAIDIAAPPDAIWPWLVQMGCRRAGWYSWDLLDNAGVPSARDVHPEWQDVKVGDVMPATPSSDDGFLVLRVDPRRALVLGGTFDLETGRTMSLGAPRPASFWEVSWAFVLEPLDARTTRLHARARLAFAGDAAKLRLAWMAPAHAIMESKQLRGIKARAEELASRDG